MSELVALRQMPDETCLTLLFPQVQEGSVFSPPGPDYSVPCIAVVICLQIINVRKIGGV